ncbi:MAG TPA: bifunctional UDP-sugar hydrolase/5'-nucleotidase [bacterium]|nr:bifunctional UDP-sugar hydrolase/5'-nucleotidase [bacterium]
MTRGLGRIGLVWVLVWILAGGECPAEIVPLTVLFTSDFHAHVSPDENGRGGAARIAGYYQQVRAEVPNVLILDAGDMISGTPISSLFKGNPVFRILNHWGLDAAALGNHEFDSGWQRIEVYREIAGFPILCANAYVMGPDGKLHILGDAEYAIFQRGALRIAVLGVITEYTPHITTRQASEGVTFVPAIPALRRLVREVQDQCDLIIALTHAGLEQDLELAKQVEGLDLIVGGHSHIRLKTERRINGVPIVHAGSKGQFIGRVDLTVDTDTDQIMDWSYRLLEVREELAPEDPATLEAVKEWESKVEELVDRPLGSASQRLTQKDLVFLAMAAFLESTGADYAYHNSGGTRGTLPAGNFTYRAVWTIYPFENTLVVAQVPGSRIPKNFYGMQPVDPAKTYKIVTNSYVRDQWEHDFPSFADIQWEETGLSMRDSILRYIEKRKTVGRIQLTR